jgi:hypothetical protein
MRWWLVDPSGLLHRILPLASSVDEASSFVRYFAERGQLLTDGKAGLLLGTNEVAAIFSFALEEQAGVDLKERYRWYGATPGEHGAAISTASLAAPVDRGWTDRLAAVGLEVVNRREAGRYVEATWALELSTEDI